MERKGIDVSSNQGNINWSAVKASGIKFAIIRCGWGKANIDSKAKANIEGALNAGLDVGVYWFLYGANEAIIKQNADGFYNFVKPYVNKITMGYWCDWEYDSDSYSIKCGVSQSKESRTKLVKAFCQSLIGKGLKGVGIYANPDYLKSKFGDVSEYPLWLAYYSSSKGSYNPMMWQHSSKGTVAGISGNVDMDIHYYTEEIKPVVPTPTPTTTYTHTQFVKEVQSAIGAKVDGIAGTETLSKTVTVSMIKNRKHKVIKPIQRYLNSIGFNCGSVDGVAGVKFDKAIRKFQQANGCVSDGEVTAKQKTWKKLLKMK